MKMAKKIKYLIPFILLILLFSLSSCDEETIEMPKTTEIEEEVTEEIEEEIEEEAEEEEVISSETEEAEESNNDEENKDLEEIEEGSEEEVEEEEVEELQYQEVTCIRVIDGDTIEVKDNAGNTFTLRYIGMDTPEEGNPYYTEATEANRFLVEGKLLRIEKDISETDKYGRLLRYVYAGELFINAHLVAEGFAQILTIPPDVKFSEYFQELQQQARNSNKGLWGLIVQEEEIQNQEQQQEETTTIGPFVGSKNSDVYHYPDCSSAKQIKEENKIWFNSVEEAKAAGYRPCKKCNPPG